MLRVVFNFIQSQKMSLIKSPLFSLSKVGRYGLSACLQRHTKVFWYISTYRGEGLKFIVTHLYCTKYNEINVYAIQICKSMFSLKNSINTINILHTGSHKSFPLHYGLQRKIFKTHFNMFILH